MIDITHKTLQDYWYNLLKESGFDDIERSAIHLKRETSHLTNQYCSDTEEYYILCRRVNHCPLLTTTYGSRDALIWELHSEGLSYDKILNHIAIHNNLLMFSKGKALSRAKIKNTIKKIEAHLIPLVKEEREDDPEDY